MKFDKLLIFSIFAFIAALTSFSGCSNNGFVDTTGLSQAVIITKPQTKSFARSFESASVATAYKTAYINPKVPANITRFLVQEGDAVRSGQPLARLDGSDYAIGVDAARSQLAAAEAGVFQAEAMYDKVLIDYERMKRLKERESISQSEYEQIKVGLKQAEAGLSVARAQRKMAQSNLNANQRQFSYTTVHAPFSGYITMRNGEIGEISAPQSPRPMFEIVQSDKLKITVFISELEIAGINEETVAEIVFDAFPGEIVKAPVSFINSKVEAMTKSVKVEFTIDNKEKKYKPGMTVRVGLTLPETEHLVIPRNAVFTRDNESGIVYYKNEADRVFTKEILLGGNVDGYSIVTRGLDGDEDIVVGGGRRLEEGQKVTVVEILESN